MKTPLKIRWPRLTKLPLGWEIALILLIKLAIIIAIKKAFFSNPQAKKMIVPMPEIEQQFFSGKPNAPAVGQDAALPATLPPQDKHESH